MTTPYAKFRPQIEAIADKAPRRTALSSAHAGAFVSDIMAVLRYAGAIGLRRDELRTLAGRYGIAGQGLVEDAMLAAPAGRTVDLQLALSRAEQALRDMALPNEFVAPAGAAETVKARLFAGDFDREAPAADRRPRRPAKADETIPF